MTIWLKWTTFKRHGMNSTRIWMTTRAWSATTKTSKDGTRSKGLLSQSPRRRTGSSRSRLQPKQREPHRLLKKSSLRRATTRDEIRVRHAMDMPQADELDVHKDTWRTNR